MPRTFSPSVEWLGLLYNANGKKKKRSIVLRRMIEIATPIVAFILGCLSTLFSILINRSIKTWGIKKSVKSVLIAFATLWEMLREDNLWFQTSKIMPLLKKGEDIRAIIMSSPTVLSNSDLREALSIADQSIYIKASADRSVLNDSFRYSKTSIDELAERARECIVKMGGKRNE